MKVAIIGSRKLNVENLQDYLPEDTDEIVSGGAKGIDTCARNFAIKNSLKLTELRPEYNKYGRGAPLKRNETIVNYADMVLAFWDGESKGTKFVINYCEKVGKECKIFIM